MADSQAFVLLGRQAEQECRNPLRRFYHPARFESAGIAIQNVDSARSLTVCPRLTAYALPLHYPRPMNANFLRDLAWVSQQMPRTERALAQLPSLHGVRLACSMHLEIKMAPALSGLLGKGATLFLTTCNPATVSDEMVQWCVAQGAQVQASRGMSQRDLDRAVAAALDFAPTHLCEMGADLTVALVARAAPSRVCAGLEATGSGTSRLAGLGNSIPYPIFNWDDLPIKEGLHNRHMVGLITCSAFLERTRLTLHGKRVVVVGYGLVGQGVADAARAFGGAVTVVERDPARALQAEFAGWKVEELPAALAKADVIITATGATHVLGPTQLDLLKDGVFLLNVGHANQEIDVPALLAHPNSPVLPDLLRVDLPRSRRVFLFAMGAMANLAAGQGDSLNAFDVTLAALVAGVGFMVTKGATYRSGLHDLPREAWLPVAERL